MVHSINDKFWLVFSKLKGSYVHKELFYNHNFKFVGEKYTFGSSMKKIYSGRGFIVFTRPEGRLEQLVSFYNSNVSNI